MLVRKLIKETEWESIIFPSHESDYDKKRNKILNKLEEHYQGQTRNIENAFNDFMEVERFSTPKDIK